MDVGIVAYRFDYYPYIRNIVGVVPGVNYCMVKDVFSRVNAGARILNRVANRQVVSTFDLNNQFYDFNLNNVDLLHFFNGVSYGRTPWVSTFETVIPRFENLVQIPRRHTLDGKRSPAIIRAFEGLSGPNCKCLIAISRCTAQMQSTLLEQFPDYKKNIEEKLVVMHPPQDLIVSKYDDKQVGLGGPIKFMFVGNAFYRKGGIEILDTLKMLREQYHYAIDLTIVSALNIDGYAVQVAPDDVRRTKVLLQENGGWIKYYPHLPNPEVLELMKQAHIGLLPTYADTFGYAVLEFQAAGCPVITTNVRALPEINDDEKGWMINVPTSDLGEALYATQSDQMILSRCIREGLEAVIHQIFADKSVIANKSAEAILSIKANHSRSDFATQMAAIYRHAVS